MYRDSARFFAEVFDVPMDEVPWVIAGICCAQFVVSRDRIRARRWEEYVTMREWVVGSELDSVGVGSVFEMFWHVVFGEDPVLYVSASFPGLD